MARSGLEGRPKGRWSAPYLEPGKGIGTGRPEIDRRLGDGIPWGSLVLVEGKHAAGKSVLCQHLTFSALQAQSEAAYYTSQTGSPSLISQMASLGLDVMDYFLLDRLRIFPLELSDANPGPVELLDRVLRHMAELPLGFRLVVVDSLTPFISHQSRNALQSFFLECRQICQQGKTIVLTLDSRPGASPFITHLARWCDIHLRLNLETVLVRRAVKALPGGSQAQGMPGRSPAQGQL